MQPTSLESVCRHADDGIEIMASNSTILTIGYGRTALEIILERLQEHATQYLIDVRASPFSRFNPDFSRPALQPVLEEAGITYVHMGEGLGGRPPIRSITTIAAGSITCAWPNCPPSNMIWTA